MTGKSTYTEETIRDFLHILAQDTPLPAGGSIAALGGALAASFGIFLARLTLRHEKNPDRRTCFQELPTHLKLLSRKCLELMDKDVKAYDQVLQALRMPQTSDEEITIRKKTLSSARKMAFIVPFQVAQKGLEILRWSRELIESGYAVTLADVAVMTEMAFSCLKSGLWIAMANLSDIDDDDFTVRHVRLVKNIQTKGEKLYNDIQKDLQVSICPED
ncbi:MAG: cyclodeaminase/cyclohydrolase family protein [Deltaproteobacteria bacterium]|nr:cyclodeaminase/cyclohydrolase family protein [Deltaproteobacteria bacterium]